MAETATATDAREGATTDPAPVDRWHAFTEWLRKLFDHERGAVLVPLLTIGLVLSVVMVGCKPVSTLDGERVTPGNINTVYEGKATALQKRHAAWVADGEQLRIEAESLDAGYDAAFGDFEEQVSQTNAVLQAIGTVGGSLIAGAFDPSALLSTVVTLGLGATAVGVGVDNRRKNKVIDRLKTNGTGA